MTLSLVGITLLGGSASLLGSEEPSPPVGALSEEAPRSIAAIFEEISPAVVGLSCRREHGEYQELYYGTGTIIDPSGLVITSTTVIPEDGEELRVYLRGGKVVPGKLVLAEDTREVTLLRIEGDIGREEYPCVTLGDSSKVRLGELALTLGNSFRSIELDDQVSLGRGIISGFYRLEPTFSQSKYVGPAIETSAPLNSGTDGGPLIDGKGRLIGVLSLNYSRSRWLGTAVPINDLKPLIYPATRWFDDGAEQLSAYVGLRLEEKSPGEVRVLSVEDDSPAATAGLSSGDTIRALDGTKMESLSKLRGVYAKLKPGHSVELRFARAGEEREVKIEPWGSF